MMRNQGGNEVGRVELIGAVPGTIGLFPLSIAALRTMAGAFTPPVSADGGRVCDRRIGCRASESRSGFISTGANPDALLLNKAQSRLYVGNAGSDTVSVIDTANDRVIATVLLRPEIAKDLSGATPTGLALSPDEEKRSTCRWRHERGRGRRSG